MKVISYHAPGLARGSGVVLHRQLFLVLRDQILRGLYAPGALLPNEETLCTAFGVSRITVLRALKDLAAEGFVERKRAVGTFVPSDFSPARTATNLDFVDLMRMTTERTQVEVLELALCLPPPDVATLLQLERGAHAVHCVRLRRSKGSKGSEGTPLLVSDAWLPRDLGKGVTAAALKRYALHALLIKQGVALGNITQEVTAVLADPQNARLLASEVGAPLLRMTRLISSVEGRPVQYLTSFVSPEKSRFIMHFPSERGDQMRGGRFIHASQEAQKPGNASTKGSRE